MKRFLAILVAGLWVALLFGTPDQYTSAKQKIESLESGRVRGGSRVTLTPAELNAYVRQEIAANGVAGVRDPRIQLGAGSATGSAMIDFGKLRRSQGHPPGWLTARLLDGERPVRVTARITSSRGRATVDVERVEISGIAIDGATLDFLIQNFLLPMYPDAAVGRPFELGHGIDRLEVQPSAVQVVVGR